jgi:hypothetical protein
MNVAAQRIEKHVAYKWEVECHFCGEVTTNDDVRPHVTMIDPLVAGPWLAAHGWREVTSRKYQVVAAACPKCASMKDSLRG